MDNFQLSSHAKTIEQHRDDLNALVDAHLNEARSRVDEIYLKHFSSPQVVLNRHWRFRGDIPKELATLPRSSCNFVKSAINRSKKPVNKQEAEAISLTGKQAELYNIIEVELLDLPGLDQKLQDYVTYYQANFDFQMSDILSGLPTQQRTEIELQLSQHIERMSLPVEGSRETVMFLFAGLIGKSLGANSFGSSIATGQAAATAIYTANLSWWSGLWVSLTGVPAWVGLVGASGGVLAALIVAPVLAPLLELGVNRFRGKKMLYAIIEQVRNRVIKPPSDAVDVIGKLAVYLQLLPDIINLAVKIKR